MSTSQHRTRINEVDHLRAWVLAASDLVKAVNVERPVDALLHEVAQQAHSLLDLDMCGVFLADPGSDRLRVHGSSGLSQEYIDRIHNETPLLVEPSDGEVLSPSVAAFKTGRTVAIPNIRSATEMGPWRQHALQEGYVALIATPLRDGNSIAGVIVGYAFLQRSFPQSQVDMLDLFAIQAGTALQAARLRDASQAMINVLNDANAKLRKQRHSLEVLDQQHRRMMQVLANDVGASGVVTMLSELLGGSVTLEEVRGEVLASAANGTYIAPPRGEERKRKDVADALAEITARRSGSISVGRPANGAPPFYVAPVTLHNEVVALLWVGGLSIELDEIGRLGIERFALTVALELSKQRNAVQVRLGLSRDLMADLLVDVRESERDTLLERAQAMGHDLGAAHQLIVLRSDTKPGALARHSLQEVADVITRRVAPHSIVGAKGSDVVVLVPTGTASAGEVARAVSAEFSRRNDGITVSAVVGATVLDLADVASQYRSARGALRLSDRRGVVVDASQLGTASLLLSHGDPLALKAFADGVLAPLERRENKGGAELTRTLQAWLDCQFSTAKTAERLFIHANTVAYRLKAVEQILGESLRSPRLLVDLNMALTIRTLHDEQDSQ